MGGGDRRGVDRVGGAVISHAIRNAAVGDAELVAKLLRDPAVSREFHDLLARAYVFGETGPVVDALVRHNASR